MNTVKKILISVSVLVPVFAYAQSRITEIILQFVFIFNRLIVIFMALGTVIFLWGVVSYVIAAGDEKKTTQAKSYMLYGIITLFVMVSVWGLVAVLQNTFGIGEPSTPLGPLL
ncbi:MAG: hypothetical protein Q8O83_01940 [bacterium]|nr:hypothetical protein [bacterium]